MLLVWRAMLVTSRERIEKLFNEGKTEQEVLAAKPLADLDAKWAANEQQAQNWTRMVYNSFSGRNHGALRRELETPAVLRLFRRFAGALAPKHNVALFLIPRSVACPCA